MATTLKQVFRPLVPNCRLRINHIERGMTLNVRLRQHLGLVARGAKGYEPHYVEVLRDLVSMNDRVFDVGANIGFYSVLFSTWVGRAGKVVAYEPDPANVNLLELNVGVNRCDNIVIRNSALGRKAGRGAFSVDKVTGATGHLGSGPTYAETIFGIGKEILVPVEVKTLDHEAEHWGPPHLIKMDVEGGEYDVLSGGSSVLKHSRPFLVTELSSWNENVTAGACKASLATSVLSDCDYKMWDLDSGEIVRAGEVAWMLLAVPQERLKEARTVKVLNRISSNT